MKTGVILNPVSGGGQVGAFLARYRQALDRHFPDHEIRMTEFSGHAREIAADFAGRGFDLVLAGGGDGTFGEVLDGLQSHPDARRIQMGLLPHGTCNDYARNFVIPAAPEARIAAIAQASPRLVDVGICTSTMADGARIDRHFINIASVGVSGAVANAVNGSRIKGRYPSLAVFIHTVREIFRFEPPAMRITVDAEVFTFRSPLVVVANAPLFGGGMLIAPMANLADGELDVVIIDASSKRDMLAILVSIYRKRHLLHPRVLIRRATKVEVALDKPQIGMLESDGEMAGQSPWRFRVCTESAQP